MRPGELRRITRRNQALTPETVSLIRKDAPIRWWSRWRRVGNRKTRVYRAVIEGKQNWAEAYKIKGGRWLLRGEINGKRFKRRSPRLYREARDLCARILREVGI